VVMFMMKAAALFIATAASGDEIFRTVAKRRLVLCANFSFSIYQGDGSTLRGKLFVGNNQYPCLQKAQDRKVKLIHDRRKRWHELQLELSKILFLTAKVHFLVRGRLCMAVGAHLRNRYHFRSVVFFRCLRWVRLGSSPPWALPPEKICE
jgi:hypothetical protein